MADKRTDVFCMAVFVVSFLCYFAVFNPQMLQPDGLSITIYKAKCQQGIKEMITCSSLLISRCQRSQVSARRKSLFIILLLVCGDIESCPGPQNISDFCAQKGLKFVHQNIRGLLNNFSLLETFVNTANSKIDILSLSETHITNSDFMDNESLYSLPGYTFINRNRKSGKGGGVAIYVKNGIKFKRREDMENSTLECIWLEIFVKKSKSLLIGCFYRPPEGSKYLPRNFNDIFNDHLSNVIESNKETIIMGDFNVNYNDKKSNNEFKSIVNTYGLKQIVLQATRTSNLSSTLIDLIMSNCPENISTVKVFALSLSDHDMVGCTRKINNIKYPMRTVKCRNYADYQPEKMCDDINDTDWQTVYQATNVNSALSIFNSLLRKVFDKHAPFIEKRVQGRSCKWLNADVKREMNNRDKQLRKARKSKNESDWANYKRSRNKCNKVIKRAKSNHHQKILNENVSNPSKFWKAISSVFPNKTRKVVTTTYDKEERISVVNNFSRYFSTAVHILKSISIPLTNFTWRFTKLIPSRTNKTFVLGYVSKVFIEKELRLLKRQKATGIDDLPPGLLKDCAKVISGPLSHIINLSIKTCTVPFIWKIAKILPAFKSGNSSLPENYRPISILPVLSKILEKAVHAQLTEFLEIENLLNDCQYGFRSKRSTKLASTLLCDKIRKEIDGGNMVGAIYIDLTKAFDTIGHNVLLNKLPSYGIHGNDLSWFTDYLFNRSQVVEINNVRSKYEPIYSGVPQGSILGPLLFNILFNDFSDHVPKSSVIKYADDTVIYVGHSDAYIIERHLNTDMNSISQYFRENELIINLKKGKTEVMLFGSSKRLKQSGKSLEVVYQGTAINMVTEYKYLGTIVDNYLTLSSNFTRSYKYASNRMRLLQRIRPFLTLHAADKVYAMMIVPLITYSSILRQPFTETQCKKLASLENRAKRIIGGKQVTRIVNLVNREACLLVKKCILKKFHCEAFDEYFQIQQHSMGTRNNGHAIKLPRVKLEVARQSFYFAGGKLYNSLPIFIRQIDDILKFKTALKEFFN